MIADLLLATIGIIWLVAASIQDIKKREVADWLSFSLIALALGIRAIYSIIWKDAFYFIYGLTGFGVFVLLAILFYRVKIFGGGDAKLLMALGAIFATRPYFAVEMTQIQLPFLFTFILNIFLVGSIYGILFALVLAIKNPKTMIKEWKKLIKQTGKMRITFIIIAFILLILSIISKEMMLIILTLFCIIFPYLFVFVKSVENSCMLKMIKTSELTEGDWLAQTLKIRGKTIKPSWEGLSKQQVKQIQKSKVKQVLVKQGLPFVPVFLLALIASFFGNILAILIEMIV